MTDKKVRTRFAPSPTGYMHIGNLRTALYAYLYAKAEHGTFILRIEDTDRARYVADAVEFINRTLKLAQIIPDESPALGGPYAPYVQSERMDIYKKYAEELVKLGKAYYCFCDPDEDHSTGKFGGYDRTCRDLPQEVIDEHLKNGDPYVIRQKMPLDGETTYFDVLHGNISIPNEELEDQVLLKRDGMPTYNFANVIDDHLMDVTHIIRGAEFITSTPKHVLLYQSYGWEIPTFIHLAPVMGKNADGSTSKLSKRHGATSFDDLVKMGYLPQAIVNYVALLGWSPKDTNQEIFSMDELISHFSLDGLSKSPAVFDYAKLGWVNGEYFKAMTSHSCARASSASARSRIRFASSSSTRRSTPASTRTSATKSRRRNPASCYQPSSSSSRASARPTGTTTRSTRNSRSTSRPRASRKASSCGSSASPPQARKSRRAGLPRSSHCWARKILWKD